MRGAGGFNGVTTYARKGLTLAADPAPLGDPALDGEGRCLLTDHGGFVVLNVYAHATGGEGAELPMCERGECICALGGKE